MKNKRYMSWLNRLPIRWVILLTPIMTFTLLLMMMGMFVHTQKAAVEKLGELQAFELKKASFFDRFSQDLSKHHSLVIKQLKISDEVEVRKIDDNGKQVIVQVENFDKRLKIFIQVSHYNVDSATSSDIEVSEKLSELLRHFNSYRQRIEEAYMMVGKDHMALGRIVSETNQNYVALNKTLIELSGLFQQRLNSAVKSSHESFSSSVDSGAIILVLFIGVFIVLSFVLSSKVSDRLKTKIESLYSVVTQDCLPIMKNTSEISLLSDVINQVKLTFSDLEETRKELDRQGNNQRNILNNMVETVISTNEGGIVLSYNAAAERLFGYVESEVIGQHIKMLIPLFKNNKQNNYMHYFHRSSDKNIKRKEHELMGLNKNNNEIPIRWSVGEYVEESGFRCFIHSCMDLTETIKQQNETESLRYQTMHDDLTKLANRHKFKYKLNQFIDKAKANNLLGVVLFIDLDRFKPVNDSAGHEAGDMLLTNIANMLMKRVRKYDTVARISGDEFCILLEGCSLINAEKVAELMRKDIDEYTFLYEEMAFDVSLSIGVTEVNSSTSTIREVLNAADNACQLAKNEGRNRVHVATPEAGELDAYVERIAWLPRINKALADNDFVLYAQKIVGLDDGDNEHHCEILLRLKNDDGTIVPPGVFIPSAERYDLMTKVDYWVLKQAFSALKPGFTYSINLSGQTVSNENLAAYIESLQATYNVNPECIIFEITETTAMLNIDTTISFIAKMQEIGYRFSLDDFGTGLSSFAYLKQLSVDYLKIDGSLVKDLATDKTSYTMVKSINEVGHSMGIQTIAEFVEDENILQKLKEIGVDNAQGYHMHKPEPLENITKVLDGNPLTIVSNG